jgi:hypothetical protein
MRNKERPSIMSDTECRFAGPVVEAHRGDNAQAPENTLAAFRLARDQGARWIELDVQQTRDNEIVVMHDPTVDRTTDGNGPVASLTLAEIRQLDAGSWFSAAFAGEPVPTLAETAALVAGSGSRLNVEVKASGLAPAEADRVIGATPASLSSASYPLFPRRRCWPCGRWMTPSPWPGSAAMKKSWPQRSNTVLRGFMHLLK